MPKNAHSPPHRPLPTYPQIYVMVDPHGRSRLSPAHGNVIVITRKWAGLRNASDNSHNIIKI